MKYNIKYSYKGGSIINRIEIPYLSSDLLENIIKYIDFNYCFNLIKLVENFDELKKIVNYKYFNEKIFLVK